MVIFRVCMKGEEAANTNTQCSPSFKKTKQQNVLPSARSDSWSGDAITLHFLCRKLADIRISALVGHSVRNEAAAGWKQIEIN